MGVDYSATCVCGYEFNEYDDAIEACKCLLGPEYNGDYPNEDIEEMGLFFIITNGWGEGRPYYVGVILFDVGFYDSFITHDLEEMIFESKKKMEELDKIIGRKSKVYAFLRNS